MKRLCALLLSLAAGAAAAQEFPTHAVRIIVPWPPSGNVDITARAIAPALGEALGQQVIVDNRAGAAGRIGSTEVAKAAPDGYTLLLGSSGTITAGPAVFKNISYQAADFVAVGAIQSVPIVLTVAPKTPVKNFADYVALAKQKGPGGVSIASAGSGSSNHLALELMMHMSGLQLLHVPYKGSGPALSDLLGSQVDSMMDQLTASIGHIREGRIRAIAISSAKRSPLLPEVPTLDELGVKGYEASTFTGIFAPAALPAPTLNKLSAALHKALSQEPVRERYRSMGVEIMDMSQADFAAYVRDDAEKWRKVARDSHISVD